MGNHRNPAVVNCQALEIFKLLTVTAMHDAENNRQIWYEKNIWDFENYILVARNTVWIPFSKLYMWMSDLDLRIALGLSSAAGRLNGRTKSVPISNAHQPALPHIHSTRRHHRHQSQLVNSLAFQIPSSSGIYHLYDALPTSAHKPIFSRWALPQAPQSP